MRKIAATFTFVVASVAAGSTVAAPAHACGMAVRREVDSRTLGIAKAERALEQGQVAAAALNVTQVFPNVRTSQPGADPLLTRAMRVMALATARADGAITVGSDWRGATPAQRAQNLEWAVTAMRAVNGARAGDPGAQGDLGEVLAKVPRFHAEALALLAGLAQRDLLGSARGYAALARLRAAAGDKPGHDAAVAKCQAMTQTPAICGAPNS